MGEKVPTGIGGLDRKLGGGLRPGTLLAIVAPPSSQSDALLHSFVRKRPTLYISTIRRQRAVEDDLGRLGRATDVTVEYAGQDVPMDNDFLVELTGERSARTEFTKETGAIDHAYEAIREFDGGGNVVVDPTNPLERAGESTAYRTMLNELKARVIDTGGVGVLHCITLDDLPKFRETTLTVADVVWELEFVSVSKGTEYRLTVPKNRGGPVVNEEVSVVLDEQVTVDDTRTF